MAKKGDDFNDPKDQLAAFKKDIGQRYMDGLISDKEYEDMLHEKEAELGLAGSVATMPSEGPECPSCGALINPQDTECRICGIALMPVLAEIQPAPGPQSTKYSVPENWKEEWIDKPYRDMPPKELLKQPPEVLKGVSKDDSDRMAEAFNVKTLGDFATIKYLAWAQELAMMKNDPQPFKKEDFEHKLIKEYEGKELDEILKAPTNALEGVSESDSKKLAKAFNVKTVEELGNLKFINWAKGIHDLAQQAEAEQPAPPRKIPENWREEWLDKPYRDLSPEELLTQPPDVLKGVSEDDSIKMAAAFNVQTLEDFTTIKYLGWAQELAELKENPGSYKKDLFRDKLIKEYEGKELDEILKAPTYALQGVSEGDSKKLDNAFKIKTVEDLGNLKFISWAKGINELAQKPEGKKPIDIYYVPENWREEWLDKPYRDLPPAELLKQPPDALKGVSKDDSKKMKDAFNIKTLEGFATTKYMIWAQELVGLKSNPEAFRNKDFEHKVIKEYEKKKLGEILTSPTYAIQGISEGDAKKLTKAFNVATIEELGTLKFIIWANRIYDMAPPKIYKVGEKVLMPSGQIGRVAYVTKPNVEGIQEIEVVVGQ